jgi:hypothetical protein
MLNGKGAWPWGSVAVALEYLGLAQVEGADPKKVDEWETQYSQCSWRRVEPGQKSGRSPLLVRRDECGE